MKAKIGLIVAAGKQSRFKSDYPKALSTINGKCILDTNYKIMSKYCDNVFIVCNFDNVTYFINHNKYYRKICINSGYGSGDAVLRALETIKELNLVDYNDKDTIFVAWGDALIQNDLYKQSLENYNDVMLIPAIKENNPYVQLKRVDYDKLKVIFNKYRELTSYGFHDMCLFLCPIHELYSNLRLFKAKFYNKKDFTYKHKHGNEFEFLDILNDTNMKANVLEVKENLATFSFNTQYELEKFNKGE